MRMKKLIGSAAVCALAVGLVVVPGAGAVKSPKLVGGAVGALVTPNPIPSTATTVTASGNVASNSSCRKDRTVGFAWVNGATVTPLAETAETGPNGNYSAVLPRPTDTPPATVALQVTVDQTFRKVGSKKKGKKTKKGRQFNCLELTGLSGPITLEAPPAP
jgi:hypothetical protein